MQELANERFEKVKLTYLDAQLLDSKDVRVIFLTASAPEKYHKYAAVFDPTRWKSR
jgi:hypothetical protein